MNRIKLKVLGLSYSMSQNGAYALILSDEDDLKRIPIVIGMSEAQSIAIQLEHIHPQRPLTHDLIKTLTDMMEVKLKEVFIYRLAAGVFYSELLFENQGNVFKLDSRTSDAIALALRYDCPIYTTTEVMVKAGIMVNSNEKDMVTPIQKLEISDYSAAELNRMLKDAIDKEEYERASEIKEMLRKKKIKGNDE